jgi:hypothetical protein
MQDITKEEFLLKLMLLGFVPVDASADVYMDKYKDLHIHFIGRACYVTSLKSNHKRLAVTTSYGLAFEAIRLEINRQDDIANKEIKWD